jgi:hypothetical protein
VRNRRQQERRGFGNIFVFASLWSKYGRASFGILANFETEEKETFLAVWRKLRAVIARERYR